METARARHRLHRVPRRRRQDRAAAAGDRRAAGRRLCRHAELPAHPAREGRRDSASHCPPSPRRSLGGEALPPPPARLVRRARHRTPSSATRTADLGLIAYETEAREGLVLDEGVIVEIVRPGTGDPVAEGEVGEVVVTTLNPDYPLIRFGTGDLSAVLPGRCPTRPHQHAHQGLARPRRPDDQGARHVRAPGRRWPRSRAAIPEVRKARLVVSGEMADDRMTLQRRSRRRVRRPGRAPRADDPRRDQAARRGRVVRSRQPARTTAR